MRFWDIIDLLLDIVFFGGIAVFALMFIAGAVITHQEKKKGVSGSAPAGQIQYVTRTCPHCGGHAGTYYTPGTESYPAMFTCSDCYRSFGSLADMTASEQSIVSAGEEECRRAERIPELEEIRRIILERVKQKDGFVSIENGRVYTTRWSGSAGFERTVLCTYDRGLGKVGDQHIAFLCMEYCRQQLRYPPNIWLMEHGVGWEWPK